MILLLRPDLCRRFRFDDPANRQAFVAWLVTTGTWEYQALFDDPLFVAMLKGRESAALLTRLQQCLWDRRPDVREAFPLPDKLQNLVAWYYTHGVGEHRLWPFLAAEEKQAVVNIEGPWKEALLARAVPDFMNEKSAVELLLGVNLIGYAFGQLGIGEDARMAARALLAAGVPVAMLNFSPGRDIPQDDRSMAEYVADAGEYAVNLFCMTALEHGRYYAERGVKQLQGRYNIGYWPWELGRWPEQWQQLVHLVDEVWVSSQHTHDAVAPVCAALSKPVAVRLMPMAVELGPIAQLGGRIKTRKRFDLPTAARLFCFSFDLNSSIHRKNPQAVVEAFLRAFPADKWSSRQVGLVVKVHPPRKRRPAWERLKAFAAKDDRVHVIEATLPRSELLALYQACDCYVSLHRAEGFGRGIAEALQLGLHVITTGYSGNVDFCGAAQFARTVDLVRYRLVKVKQGQYPFAANQLWANADVRHAAECMAALVEHYPPGAQNAPPHPTPTDGWPMFSAAEVGARYRQRLQEIQDQLNRGSANSVRWPTGHSYENKAGDLLHCAAD